MPAETIYVDMGKGAHKFCRGILTGAEILAMGRKQAAEVEATRQLKYFLYDLSAVTDYNITPNDVAMLVEINRTTAANSLGALGAIVAANPLAFGLARVWQSLAQDIGWKVRVFQTRADAIAWLRKELGGGDPESAVLAEYPSLKMD
jgi:hypothetical protein